MEDRILTGGFTGAASPLGDTVQTGQPAPMGVSYADYSLANASGGGASADSDGYTPPPAEVTPEHVAAFESLTTQPLVSPAVAASTFFVLTEAPLPDPLAPPATPPTNPSSSSPPASADPSNPLAGNAGGSTSLVTPPATPPGPGAPPAGPTNPPPVVPPPTGLYAQNDLYALDNHAPNVVGAGQGVLINDSNPIGVTRSTQLVTTTSHGSLAFAGDGSFVYTASAGYSGQDSFTYVEVAGGMTSNVATVTLDIANVPNGGGGTTTSSPTFTWTQTPPVPPTITNPGNQTGLEGQAVSLGITASGTGPFHYAALELPTGLTMNAATGIISGTPSNTSGEDLGGSYTTTVIVSGADGGSATIQFGWTIAPALTLTNPGDQSNTVGDTVSLKLVASGFTGDALEYSVDGLPSGLAVDQTGLISGTIDSSAPASNSVTATVIDTVSGAIATQKFNWTVAPAIQTPAGPAAYHPPTMDTLSNQTNAVGDSVDFFVSASGSNPLSYTATGLPTDLTIEPGTGEITGTLSNAAYSARPYQVTVTASDGTNSVSQSFALTVGPISLPNPGHLSNAIGDTVSLSMAGRDATGGTLSYSVTGLPPGLMMDPAGHISGTIAAGATWQDGYTVTVQATDGIATTSRMFDWAVTPAPGVVAPTFSVVPPPAATVGQAVSFPISATSANGGALTFVADGLPAGLEIDPTTGIISGTPNPDAVGTASVTIGVIDPMGGYASTTFQWTVNPNEGAIAVIPLGVVEGNDTGIITVARFTTPDLSTVDLEYTATIHWGDGTTDAGTMDGSQGVMTVSGDHTYASPGSYTVSVTVKSPDGATVTGTGTATVATATVTPISGFQEGVLEAQAGELITEFNYGNPTASAAGFSVRIDPGDGSGLVTGTVSAMGDGLFAVSLPHGYAHFGGDVATIMITDPHGATTTTTSTQEVGDLIAGLPSTLTAATFDVGNPQAQAADYTATIQWGDGSASSVGTVTGSGGRFTVQGQHTYTTDSIDVGAYLVNVTLSKPGQLDVIASHGVVVTRPTMTGQIAELPAKWDGTVESQPIAAFEVPNNTDTASWFQATINWGDGTSSLGTISGGSGLFVVTGGHTYASTSDHVIQVDFRQRWGDLKLALVKGARAAGFKLKTVYVNKACSVGIFMDGANQTYGNQSNIARLYKKYAVNATIPVLAEYYTTNLINIPFRSENPGAVRDAALSLIKAWTPGSVKVIAGTTAGGRVKVVVVQEWSIDIFGWSRGAMAALMLVEALGNAYNIRELGLFDPVNSGMLTGRFGTMNIPKSVKNLIIERRDADAYNKDWMVFKVIPTISWNDGWTDGVVKEWPLSHEEIGFDDGPFDHMLKMAKADGVPFE